MSALFSISLIRYKNAKNKSTNKRGKAFTLGGDKMIEEIKAVDNKVIGANVRKIRISRGITQIQLAKLLEISQTHMSNIENGNTGISLSTAMKIGKCLQFSIDTLVYGDISEREKSKGGLSADFLSGLSAEDLLKALGLIALGKEYKINNCDLERK